MSLPVLLAAVLAWGPVIDREARAAHVDAVVLEALVQHESQGIASAIGPAPFLCIGLVQVCPRTFSVCHDDLDAPACAAVRAHLLDGAYNLHVGAGMLARWTAFCRRVTGRAEARHVLSGYGGLDGHGVVCGQRRAGKGWRDVPITKTVRDILAIAAQIRRGRR